MTTKNLRTEARDKAINLALKHLENARKQLDGFNLDWYDLEANAEAGLILQMQNRLRNIQFGRMVFLNNGKKKPWD